MKQEDKELLLIDLCGRLPYGVKVKINNINVLKLGTHTRVGEYVTDVIEPCKPYLFPLSSMTDEQKKEYRKVCELDTERLSKHPMDGTPFPALYNSQDWLSKHHFDYRGLIEKGLAIDATNLNIY